MRIVVSHGDKWSEVSDKSPMVDDAVLLAVDALLGYGFHRSNIIDAMAEIVRLEDEGKGEVAE